MAVHSEFYVLATIAPGKGSASFVIEKKAFRHCASLAAVACRSDLRQKCGQTSWPFVMDGEDQQTFSLIG
jgi:hypothetical protein